MFKEQNYKSYRLGITRKVFASTVLPGCKPWRQVFSRCSSIAILPFKAKTSMMNLIICVQSKILGKIFILVTLLKFHCQICRLTLCTKSVKTSKTQKYLLMSYFTMWSEKILIYNTNAFDRHQTHTVLFGSIQIFPYYVKYEISTKMIGTCKFMFCMLTKQTPNPRCC